MFLIKYYRADSATYVIKNVGGKAVKQGKGLSFLYNSATTSIAAVPVSVQEAPFIFNLQTADYQEISVQGQVGFRIEDPVKIADMLNFTLLPAGRGYVSEDPLMLDDRVVRTVQSVIQKLVQGVALRNALRLNQEIVDELKSELPRQPALTELGLCLMDVSIAVIAPSSETARALEAEAREAILKEADDAIYDRRKSAVEQERMIKNAELETELAVQQKEQEIAESRIANQRDLMRAEFETEQERIRAEIGSEEERKALVLLSVENNKQKADSDAYAIRTSMQAYRELPVENLKAMALANMQPEQMMAMAFDSLAQNAGKIGELNVSPDLFSHLIKKGKR